MLYQQLIDSEISVWNRPNVQQMMDSSPSMGNPMLLVLNPLRILARHHVDIMPNHQRIVQRCACFRRPNTGDSADALSKKSQKLMVPPTKRVAPLESLDPQNSFRVQRVFRCDFSLEPDLNGRQFKSKRFLKKLRPFYTFWCELNSEMIWKMTWYSYVTTWTLKSTKKNERLEFQSVWATWPTSRQNWTVPNKTERQAFAFSTAACSCVKWAQVWHHRPAIRWYF